VINGCYDGSTTSVHEEMTDSTHVLTRGHTVLLNEDNSCIAEKGNTLYDNFFVDPNGYWEYPGTKFVIDPESTVVWEDQNSELY
jgi:hypothetical protein